MIYEVGIGDRVRTVAVVRKGARLQVELDGRIHIVDARRVSESVVSMLVQLDGADAPSRSIDVAFVNLSVAGDYDVHLNGRTVAAQIRPAGSWGRQKKAGGGAAGTGPQRVTSPMPGRVVRVLVQPGEDVKARQGLLVVEAMKMENELRAGRDGRVREVSVAEGQSVDAGTVLLIVD